MTTLKQVLETASHYWNAKGVSSRMMPLRAAKCAELLFGAADLRDYSRTDTKWLTPQDGTHLLTALAKDGLSKASQASYYAAFRRALALSGISTKDWPAGAKPARRVRDPLEDADLERLHEWMADQGWTATANLITLLRHTGMRVEVEALNPAAWALKGDTLRITGKGGHERVIPVPEVLARKLVDHHKALVAIRSIGYSAHLKRWQKGVTALGISSRLPTPHAVRHLYATKAYEKSGRNLRVVQDLLGHADIATTARYIGVNMQELRDAVE